jgi:hypothetical protein
MGVGSTAWQRLFGVASGPASRCLRPPKEGGNVLLEKHLWNLGSEGQQGKLPP